MREYDITLDPGISGTGWAIWWHTREDTDPPVATGTISTPSHMDWLDRALTVSKLFDDLVSQYPPKRVVIEWPLFYDDAGGHKVAKSGTLFELCCLIGMLIKKVSDTSDVHLVNARWKGQLSKAPMIGRIKKRLGSGAEGISSHAWDAVGIGLHDKGVF